MRFDSLSSLDGRDSETFCVRESGARFIHLIFSAGRVTGDADGCQWCLASSAPPPGGRAARGGAGGRRRSRFELLCLWLLDWLLGIPITFKYCTATRGLHSSHTQHARPRDL